MLIDNTGGSPVANSAITIVDGRIDAIGVRVENAEDAEIIDVSGLTILPRLMDSPTYEVKRRCNHLSAPVCYRKNQKDYLSHAEFHSLEMA
jgi:hypothetical protein